jgi:mRNA interferase MazF
MAIQFAPAQGTIVTVDFDQGFRAPEMVKRRLAIVISPRIKERGQLLTVVPLSMTVPAKVMPYHCQIDIPFALPAFWGQQKRWVKGDLVNAVGFHRVDLLAMGKDLNGKRIFQTAVLPAVLLQRVQQCVLHSLGL